ncbi:MAG: hypothetical protein LBQ62_07205 [Candidatus Accumulibacter sp.]|jgi:hypothetical protein|nr:hypothetical protein [Accumulibacter sp.]
MKKYTQADLAGDLAGIFPEFGPVWAADHGGEFSSSNLHSVYQSFLPFLASVRPGNEQWKLVADHLNKAVAAGGDQENAAATCVLEHLHHVKIHRVLWPLLSKEARACVRA